MKISKKLREFKEKIGKLKKKKVKEEPNWTYILEEPYCMTRSSRGLKLEKKVKQTERDKEKA